MAEGLCRHYRVDLIEPYSAGIEKHGMNPFAISVMEELGIDLSSQHSKTLDELDSLKFDYVITVCDHARTSCPYFPAIRGVIHHGFEDPPALAENAPTTEDALQHYRRVRDEIREYTLSLPQALENPASASVIPFHRARQ